MHCCTFFPQGVLFYGNIAGNLRIANLRAGVGEHLRNHREDRRSIDGSGTDPIHCGRYDYFSKTRIYHRASVQTIQTLTTNRVRMGCALCWDFEEESSLFGTDEQRNGMDTISIFDSPELSSSSICKKTQGTPGDGSQRTFDMSIYIGISIRYPTQRTIDFPTHIEIWNEYDFDLRFIEAFVQQHLQKTHTGDARGWEAKHVRYFHIHWQINTISDTARSIFRHLSEN